MTKLVETDRCACGHLNASCSNPPGTTFLAREWQDKAEEYRAERDALRDQLHGVEALLRQHMTERDALREERDEFRDKCLVASAERNTLRERLGKFLAEDYPGQVAALREELAGTQRVADRNLELYDEADIERIALRAKVERLRSALERIAADDDDSEPEQSWHIARTALEPSNDTQEDR